MSKIKDLSGTRFGKLTAIEIIGRTPQKLVLWRCLCDCGNITDVRSSVLINGTTKSCGCSKKEAAQKKLLDVTNEKFGRLTAIKRSEHRLYGRVSWDCICDCGKEITVTQNNLSRGNTTSCGCYNLELIKNNKHSVKDDSGVCYLYEWYRSHAQEKNRVFEISLEHFKSLTSSNCFYCGIPPQKTIKSRKAKVPYNYNGVDRQDNNVGYVPENCVPCCSFCNYAKRNHSYEDFQNWIKRLIDFHRKD